MNKIYQVDVYEVWTRSVTVEAANEDEARELANSHICAGNGIDVFDYSHTLDTDEWYVSDVTEQVKNSQLKVEVVTKG